MLTESSRYKVSSPTVQLPLLNPLMPGTTYTDSDAERLIGTEVSAPPKQVEKLSLPVALPQIAAGFDAPFLRGYGDLASSGIRQDDWLRFVDGLNVALVRRAVLR